jgi:hypothetical protein
MNFAVTTTALTLPDERSGSASIPSSTLPALPTPISLPMTMVPCDLRNLSALASNANSPRPTTSTTTPLHTYVELTSLRANEVEDRRESRKTRLKCESAERAKREATGLLLNG